MVFLKNLFFSPCLFACRYLNQDLLSKIDEMTTETRQSLAKYLKQTDQKQWKKFLQASIPSLKKEVFYPNPTAKNIAKADFFKYNSNKSNHIFDVLLMEEYEFVIRSCVHSNESVFFWRRLVWGGSPYLGRKIVPDQCNFTESSLLETIKKYQKDWEKWKRRGSCVCSRPQPSTRYVVLLLVWPVSLLVMQTHAVAIIIDLKSNHIVLFDPYEWPNRHAMPTELFEVLSCFTKVLKNLFVTVYFGSQKGGEKNCSVRSMAFIGDIISMGKKGLKEVLTKDCQAVWFDMRPTKKVCGKGLHFIRS